MSRRNMIWGLVGIIFVGLVGWFIISAIVSARPVPTGTPNMPAKSENRTDNLTKVHP
jgi:hypothetical protein